MMSLTLQPAITSSPIEGLPTQSQTKDSESTQPISFGEVLKVEEKKLEQETNATNIAAILATLQTPAPTEPMIGLDASVSTPTSQSNASTAPVIDPVQSAASVLRQGNVTKSTASTVKQSANADKTSSNIRPANTQPKVIATKQPAALGENKLQTTHIANNTSADIAASLEEDGTTIQVSAPKTDLVQVDREVIPSNSKGTDTAAESGQTAKTTNYEVKTRPSPTRINIPAAKIAKEANDALQKVTSNTTPTLKANSAPVAAGSTQNKPLPQVNLTATDESNSQLASASFQRNPLTRSPKTEGSSPFASPITSQYVETDKVIGTPTQPRQKTSSMPVGEKINVAQSETTQAPASKPIAFEKTDEPITPEVQLSSPTFTEQNFVPESAQVTEMPQTFVPAVVKKAEAQEIPATELYPQQIRSDQTPAPAEDQIKIQSSPSAAPEQATVLSSNAKGTATVNTALNTSTSITSKSENTVDPQRSETNTNTAQPEQTKNLARNNSQQFTETTTAPIVTDTQVTTVTEVKSQKSIQSPDSSKQKPEAVSAEPKLKAAQGKSRINWDALTTENAIRAHTTSSAIAAHEIQPSYEAKQNPAGEVETPTVESPLPRNTFEGLSAQASVSKPVISDPPASTRVVEQPVFSTAANVTTGNKASLFQPSMPETETEQPEVNNATAQIAQPSLPKTELPEKVTQTVKAQDFPVDVADTPTTKVEEKLTASIETPISVSEAKDETAASVQTPAITSDSQLSEKQATSTATPANSQKVSSENETAPTYASNVKISDPDGVKSRNIPTRLEQAPTQIVSEPVTTNRTAQSKNQPAFSKTQVDETKATKLQEQANVENKAHTSTVTSDRTNAPMESPLHIESSSISKKTNPATTYAQPETMAADFEKETVTISNAIEVDTESASATQTSKVDATPSETKLDPPNPQATSPKTATQNMTTSTVANGQENSQKHPPQFKVVQASETPEVEEKPTSSNRSVDTETEFAAPTKQAISPNAASQSKVEPIQVEGQHVSTSKNADTEIRSGLDVEVSLPVAKTTQPANEVNAPKPETVSSTTTSQQNAQASTSFGNITDATQTTSETEQIPAGKSVTPIIEAPHSRRIFEALSTQTNTSKLVASEPFSPTGVVEKSGFSIKSDAEKEPVVFTRTIEDKNEAIPAAQTRKAEGAQPGIEPSQSVSQTTSPKAVNQNAAESAGTNGQANTQPHTLQSRTDQVLKTPKTDPKPITSDRFIYSETESSMLTDMPAMQATSSNAAVQTKVEPNKADTQAQASPSSPAQVIETPEINSKPMASRFVDSETESTNATSAPATQTTPSNVASQTKVEPAKIATQVHASPSSPAQVIETPEINSKPMASTRFAGSETESTNATNAPATQTTPSNVASQTKVEPAKTDTQVHVSPSRSAQVIETPEMDSKPMASTRFVGSETESTNATSVPATQTTPSNAASQAKVEPAKVEQQHLSVSKDDEQEMKPELTEKVYKPAPVTDPLSVTSQTENSSAATKNGSTEALEPTRIEAIPVSVDREFAPHIQTTQTVKVPEASAILESQNLKQFGARNVVPDEAHVSPTQTSAPEIKTGQPVSRDTAAAGQTAPSNTAFPATSSAKTVSLNDSASNATSMDVPTTTTRLMEPSQSIQNSGLPAKLAEETQRAEVTGKQSVTNNAENLPEITAMSTETKVESAVKAQAPAHAAPVSQLSEKPMTRETAKVTAQSKAAPIEAKTTAEPNATLEATPIIFKQATEFTSQPTAKNQRSEHVQPMSAEAAPVEQTVSPKDTREIETASTKIENTPDPILTMTQPSTQPVNKEAASLKEKIGPETNLSNTSNVPAEKLFGVVYQPKVQSEAMVSGLGNAQADTKTEPAESSERVGIPTKEKEARKSATEDATPFTNVEKGNVEIKAAGKATTALVDTTVFDVVQQITTSMKTRIKNGETSVRIQLNPKELGAIEVQVTHNAQGVSVSFVAEKASTSQLIESQAGQLRQSLKDAGVQLSNLNINQHNQPNQEGGFRQSQSFVQTPRRNVSQQAETMTEERMRPQRIDGSTSEIDYLV